RECGIWLTLKHPNITPFLGWALKISNVIHAHIFTELAVNHSIARFIKSHPDANMKKLLRDSAEGIEYLHAEGIIHGDIKPTNILVNSDLRAVLCDFGLARRIGDPQTDPQDDSVNTTHQYSAPELLLGISLEPPVRTEATDVWAFGCTGLEVRGFKGSWIVNLSLFFS
ncbi:kinase-like domain-containing protein, partial [Cantharellus anzutake]|uniref:kinase-like domain-containing protein n=1 Tax=Cantharellus anzutake TaxID=1750568 RepID=UPI001906A543